MQCNDGLTVSLVCDMLATLSTCVARLSAPACRGLQFMVVLRHSAASLSMSTLSVSLQTRYKYLSLPTAMSKVSPLLTTFGNKLVSLVSSCVSSKLVNV